MITLIQKPQLYTPAYNRNQFVAFSTLAAANNDFVYKVLIQTPVGITYYDYPKQPNSYGIFDASNAVKNAIRHAFDADRATPYIATGKSIEVSVTVTEYYGGTSYGAVSYDYFAFDACLLLDTFRGYDFNDYVSGYNSPISFLSPNINDPALPQASVNLDSDLWISFYLGQCEQIDLIITDELNAPVGTLNFPIASPQPTEIYTFNIGNRSTTLAGYPLQNGYSVEVVFMDGASNVILSRQYTIAERCSKYERYTVYYLKRNGAIGFFTFDKLSQKTISKSENKVRHNRMFFDGSEYTYNTYSRETHTVNTILSTRMVLNTDWITEVQMKGLEELFSSPIRWISAPGNIAAISNYIPVDLVDNDFVPAQHVNQKLFNYTINVEFSQQEGRQRGV